MRAVVQCVFLHLASFPWHVLKCPSIKYQVSLLSLFMSVIQTTYTLITHHWTLRLTFFFFYCEGDCCEYLNINFWWNIYFHFFGMYSKVWNGKTHFNPMFNFLKNVLLFSTVAEMLCITTSKTYELQFLHLFTNMLLLKGFKLL